MLLCSFAATGATRGDPKGYGKIVVTSPITVRARLHVPSRVRDLTAAYFTRSNLGLGDEDPEYGVGDLYESETEKLVNGELKAWTNAFAKVVEIALKLRLPLTIRTMEELWEDKSNKLNNHYK